MRFFRAATCEERAASATQANHTDQRPWRGVSPDQTAFHGEQVSEGERKMRTLLGLPILAVLLAAFSVNTASASCCGAASYKNCTAPAADTGSYCTAQAQCHTVMKTCKKVVYEKQQYTCYKTCYDTVYVDKTVN